MDDWHAIAPAFRNLTDQVAALTNYLLQVAKIKLELPKSDDVNQANMATLESLRSGRDDAAEEPRAHIGHVDELERAWTTILPFRADEAKSASTITRQASENVLLTGESADREATGCCVNLSIIDIALLHDRMTRILVGKRSPPSDINVRWATAFVRLAGVLHTAGTPVGSPEDVPTAHDTGTNALRTLIPSLSSPSPSLRLIAVFDESSGFAAEPESPGPDPEDPVDDPYISAAGAA